MKALKLWFDGRSLREKRLLLVMGALLVVTLLWGGLLRPLGDGLSSARERHADAVIRLGEAQAIAAELNQRRRRPAALVGNAGRYGACLGGAGGLHPVRPDRGRPRRVRAQIASARPAALTPWLARLERGGVLVEQATLTDNGDKTVGVALSCGRGCRDAVADDHAAPVLFAAMLVVALIVFLPMRLALGATGLADEGLSARGSAAPSGRQHDRGAVWRRGAGRPARVAVAAGAAGRRAKLAFEGAGVDGRPIAGSASISRHAMGIDGVTASLPAATLFAPLPVTTLALEDVTVRFRDGCVRKRRAGCARPWWGRRRPALAPTMMGTARCEAGALLLPMTGQGGTEAVNLRIRPDGRYTADLVLTPAIRRRRPSWSSWASSRGRVVDTDFRRREDSDGRAFDRLTKAGDPV